MNERIEKLLVEAHRQTKGGIYSGHPSEVFEKFAELIVRECADIANTQFSAASGLNDRDCWTAAEIKKHFGVE